MTGNGNIQTYLADFTSLDEVRNIAKEILAEHDSLDLFINNAGAGFSAPRFGKDGTETRFTVNYLAPFLLTHLLLPPFKNQSHHALLMLLLQVSLPFTLTIL